MMVLTVFKVLLYKTIRDKSILLDGKFNLLFAQPLRPMSEIKGTLNLSARNSY